MATDSEGALFRAASAAYESGRARWASLSVIPLAIIPLGSFAVGHRLGSSVALGLALLAVGALMLWRGQAFSRGLAVGLKAGFVPLVVSHAANLYGHICTAEGCTSLCVPAYQLARDEPELARVDAVCVPAGHAYDAYRAAWLAWVTALEATRRTGQPAPNLLEAGTRAGLALADLSRAVDALRGRP